MNADEVLSLGAQALALLLTVGAFAGAVGAMTARSLYAMCVHLVVTGAYAAASMLALGAGDGALAQALLGVALTPVVLLAAMLLSARAAKPRRSGLPWLTLAAAAGAAVAVLWVMPALGAPAPPAPIVQTGGLAPWLAALVFVSAAACVGLLGYGERGALQRLAPRGDE